ncbi:hypothetical protein ACJMK2_003949 [Sinanodonta woodiana]|uniref:G-protein coupled receptors family 1 profile domain-containing protein n=1 Tax=Sinanodonta woodiana TaxID=1069815 RepID=A0ABD3XZR2_SINWO
MDYILSTTTNRTEELQSTMKGNVHENVTQTATMNTYYSLEEINDKVAHLYLIPSIFVGILMFIGVIGNGLVLYIYILKFKASNHRVFILGLSSVDFITCSIGMPFVIFDFRYSIIFYAVSVCKILRFVNYFMCSSSAFILTAIAVDRYRKICLPGRKQMSLSVARMSCCISVTLALAISWPAPVLYGYSTAETGYGNLTGVSCQTEDKFKDTSYQAYFNFMLLVLMFCLFFVLTALYSLIARQIYNHGKNARQRCSHKTGNNEGHVAFLQRFKRIQIVVNDKKSIEKDIDDSSQVDNITASEKPTLPCAEKENGSNININSISDSLTKAFSASNPSKMKTRNKYKNTLRYSRKLDSLEKCAQRKYRRLFRTTYMLLIISVFFFISYFPHIFIHILTFVKKDFVSSMSNTWYVVYVVFLYSFFVNNVANPLIYGFCDSEFRKELRNLCNPGRL